MILNSIIKTIMKEIKHNFNQTPEKCMVLGDFNGHVGYLGPDPTNKNGEILLDFIDKNNLIMLNGHADCKGEITWEQRNRKSVIDYIIDNKSLHNNFECMKIDEDNLEFDLSDHNLLTAQFHFNRCSSRFEKHRTKEISYLKTNDVTKQNFLDTVKKELRNRETSGITIEKYEEIITDAKDSCLMKKMKKKIPKQSNKEDNIWFNKDIEMAIKTRKLYNRQKRK